MSGLKILCAKKVIILYLFQTGHFAPVSHSAAQQRCPPHFPQCWCCSHPGQCLSEGRLEQSSGTQRSSGQLKGKHQRKKHYNLRNQFCNNNNNNAWILWAITNIRTRQVVKTLTIATFFASSSDIVLIWSCKEQIVKLPTNNNEVLSLNIQPRRHKTLESCFSNEGAVRRETLTEANWKYHSP